MCRTHILWGGRWKIERFCVSVNYFDTCKNMWFDMYPYDLSYESHLGQNKHNKVMFTFLKTIKYVHLLSNLVEQGSEFGMLPLLSAIRIKIFDKAQNN